MRLLPKLMAVAVATAALTSPILAHDYRLGAIQIDHPWTRATPPGAHAGGGFLTLTNEGVAADRLVAAVSPIAGRTELHTMTMDDGVMKMRPLPEGIELPAGATVELAPGGMHVMFMDLAGPIVEGDSVPVTLTFETAGSIEVEMAVSPPGARQDGAHGHEEGGTH